MLAWYIDWYRTSLTCSGDKQCVKSQLLDFPLAPFFAIFCRSWLMVCIVGELLRFCFILAQDVWEEDPFITYRRVLCCDFELEELNSARRATGRSTQRSDSRCCGFCCPLLDLFLQCSIYVALDIWPLVQFVIAVFTSGSGQLGQAVVEACVSLAAGSCFHVFLFFLSVWLTDIFTKYKAFLEAWRGVARLQPCEYPGEAFRPRADFTIQYSASWGSHLVNCIDGELSTDYMVKDRWNKEIPLLTDRRFVPDRDQFPLEIWRKAERLGEESSLADQRNLCVFLCKGWSPAKAFIQKMLPHLLCDTASDL
eukprot:Skav219693  [mRNA]  locus=scaffold817:196422:202954:+ [translate_table: standard]